MKLFKLFSLSRTKTKKELKEEAGNKSAISTGVGETATRHGTGLIVCPGWGI